MPVGRTPVLARAMKRKACARPTFCHVSSDCLEFSGTTFIDRCAINFYCSLEKSAVSGAYLLGKSAAVVMESCFIGSVRDVRAQLPLRE